MPESKEPLIRECLKLDKSLVTDEGGHYNQEYTYSYRPIRNRNCFNGMLAGVIQVIVQHCTRRLTGAAPVLISACGSSNNSRTIFVLDRCWHIVALGRSDDISPGD